MVEDGMELVDELRPRLLHEDPGTDYGSHGCLVLARYGNEAPRFGIGVPEILGNPDGIVAVRLVHRLEDDVELAWIEKEHLRLRMPFKEPCHVGGGGSTLHDDIVVLSETAAQLQPSVARHPAIEHRWPRSWVHEVKHAARERLLRKVEAEYPSGLHPFRSFNDHIEDLPGNGNRLQKALSWEVNRRFLQFNYRSGGTSLNWEAPASKVGIR